MMSSRCRQKCEVKYSTWYRLLKDMFKVQGEIGPLTSRH